MKKRYLLLLPILLLILVVLLSFYFWNKQAGHDADLADSEDIYVQYTEKYLSELSGKNISIVDNSKLIEKNGIRALVVKYQMDNKPYAACIYFTRNFWGRYEATGGSISEEVGKIETNNQMIDGMNVLFIYGIDIPENISSFSIADLAYEDEVPDNTYVNILILSSDYLKSHEVTGYTTESMGNESK